MRVLVVGENPEVRKAVSKLIARLGHKVVEASSGRGALALLEYYKPDIVFTDRRMPGMSGEELIRQIKASKPHLPIVLMTTDDLSDIERSVITAAGASAILHKPFSEGKLERVLDRVTRISPMPS